MKSTPLLFIQPLFFNFLFLCQMLLNSVDGSELVLVTAVEKVFDVFFVGGADGADGREVGTVVNLL